MTKIDIGSVGSAILNIEDGGTLLSQSALIGANVGSNGTVLVHRAGSKWSITPGLSVGQFGDSTLTIADGGIVDSNSTVVSLGAALLALRDLTAPPGPG